jgi:hypothetical protein
LSLPMALQRTKTFGIVAAFRPSMLADYAYARDEIHEVKSDQEIELIERLDTASLQDIDRGVPASRRIAPIRLIKPSAVCPPLPLNDCPRLFFRFCYLAALADFL